MTALLNPPLGGMRPRLLPRLLPCLLPCLLPSLLLALAIFFTPVSGQTAWAAPMDDDALATADWPAIEAAAKGGEVRFFMWGGAANINQWVDSLVAPALESNYGITLKRVPMDAAIFMNKLLAEKAAGKKEGSIDLLWINGENFKNAMEAQLLYGPFAERLPNFQAYVDPTSVEHDFGFPTKGYEAPYGRAQFVFEFDSARTPEPPRSFAALADWVMANPGQFTYPQPPDFTGSAFIRQAFYATTGGHEQYMSGYDQALFDANAPKLWAYLNALKPHLWQEGQTYPKDAAALDTLFARGEVAFSMSYHPSHAQSQVLKGAYPDTVRTFVMEEGSIFNTHFTAIPANSPHKAAAMVAANFLLSPEAQLSKLDPKNWGDFPAIDLEKLDADTKAKFAAVDLGAATLGPDALNAAAVPEIPSAYVEALEKGWEASVLQ